MGYFDDMVFVNVNELKDYREPGYSSSGKYSSFELLWKGRIRIIQDGKETTLTAPSVFWHSQGEKFGYGKMADGETRNHIWANFVGARGERLPRGLTEDIPERHTLMHKADECHALFYEMLLLFRQHNPENHYRMVVLLEQLAGLTLEAGRFRRMEAPGVEQIRRLVEEVRKQPLEDWDFHAEARQASMSYSSLRAYFRRINGMAPHEFLLRCRMSYAVKLFMDEDMTVKRAAELCRFEDLSSFSRLFKQKIGISPRDFLRGHRNS